jgi:MurNAc alpha-1-phosphate uridylyltransferase
VQLVAPALFADAPEGPFSINILWDRAIASDRLRAVVHDGIWLHLSTPEDLTEAEEMLRGRSSVFAYAR